MIVVIDTTILVDALLKPGGVAFRLLRLLNGLPIADTVVTDITGWEFVRVARNKLDYDHKIIAEFLDTFDRLFAADAIAESPVSRRLLGGALDNVTLERAAEALTGRSPAEFLAEIPAPLQPLNVGRDSNDLHVVWAVVHYGADVLCTTDNGFRGPLGSCVVMTPRELIDRLTADEPE